MIQMKPWMTDLKQNAARILPEGFHLYLFGSHAHGMAKQGSDYDLGVLGARPCPPGLLSELEELGETLPTLDKLDWWIWLGSRSPFGMKPCAKPSAWYEDSCVDCGFSGGRGKTKRSLRPWPPQL